MVASTLLIHYSLFYGGSKFSEFRNPFVCYADISPNRGITPALSFINLIMPC